MPLWTDAYLADTRHLSDAEHGRYLLMLMEMWRSPGCRFPNDRAWLVRRFRRDPETFARDIQPLLDEFFSTDGNWITQKRLKREWERLRGSSQKQSARAKSRWDKEKGSSRGNASAAMPYPQPQPYKKDISDASHPHPPSGGRKRKSYPEAFQLFWLAYPKRGTDTKADAFKAWDKARQAGTDVATLHDGAERYAAFAGSTGCETKHVQTWINREGWTASYAKPIANGQANGYGRPSKNPLTDAYRRLQQLHREDSPGFADPEGNDPLS